MLEFKNVCVGRPDGHVSAPFSLEMDGGEVACLVDNDGVGSRVLMAVMGLAPLAAGYITVDGELVTPGSSAYFRRMIAYVPQRMPSLRMRVSRLFGDLLHLDAQAEAGVDLSALQRQWTQAGLPEGLAEQWTTEVAPAVLQTAMLGAALLLKRPMVLVDSPSAQAVDSGLLRLLAAGGTEVLCATQRSDVPCQKIINLSLLP